MGDDSVAYHFRQNPKTWSPSRLYTDDPFLREPAEEMTDGCVEPLLIHRFKGDHETVVSVVDKGVGPYLDITVLPHHLIQQRRHVRFIFIEVDLLQMDRRLVEEFLD